MFVVTGGAGFIGSNLVYRLNNIGISDIIIVDNLKNPIKHRNLNALKFYDFIDKQDFLENLRKKTFNNIEVIFHQGACSNTMETDGTYMMKNNYEYSKILLNYCIENNIRFIYASSASVYGNGLNGFKEESSCEYPLNIYAFSKYIFDNYVRNIFENNYKKPDKLPQIVGLRYFNVYGPGENHKNRMASTVFHFYNEIQNEKKIKLFEGSENFLRDFVYVEDVADVNIFFLDNPDKSGIFNCGTGKAQSFLKIAKILNEEFPFAKIEFIPFPNELLGKYQKFTQANLENLRKIGYLKDFTPLEIGVRKYLKILIENEGYLKKG